MMHSKFERARKKAVVACFKILSLQPPGKIGDSAFTAVYLVCRITLNINGILYPTENST